MYLLTNATGQNKMNAATILNKAKAHYYHLQAKADELYNEAEKNGSYGTFLAAEAAQETVLDKVNDYVEMYRRNGWA